MELLPQAAERMRAHVELTGSVPRSEVHAHFAWADVFLLPSICEGSATVTYEALAHGLPVICTKNTGSVVRDGIDGFIVPEADAPAIVERLELLLSDRGRIEQMSTHARSSSRDFTVKAYGKRLLKALDGVQSAS
jgi:glycosyltransferase involved in cell wall biosynthesis